MLSRYIAAFLQVIAGTFGVVVNLLVIKGLGHCSRLNDSMIKFMKSVCLANLCGLIPLLFYTPLALAFSSNFFQLGSISMNFLAGMLILSVYSQLVLQAVMAVNRMYAFRNRSTWFTSFRVKILIGGCFIYGGTLSVAGFFPCCTVAYLGPEAQWITNGTHHYILEKIQFFIDTATFTTMFTCQIIAFLSIGKLRKQIRDKKISAERFKVEIRVLIQLCLVSAIWLVYGGLFRLMQFLPSARGIATIVISETFRYLFLTIDPTLNLMFLKQLRQYLYFLFTCQSANQVHPISMMGLTRKD